MISDRIFEDLRRRIEMENKSGCKRMYFSQGTKNEIEKLFNSGFSLNVLSARLDVSHQTLSKWKRAHTAAVPKPRKLAVVNEFLESTPQVQSIAANETVDVMLPNGILLKNFGLNAQSLALLKGL